MDVQLQELVNKIKKDGIESAEAQASEIILAAEKTAAQTIDSAKKEADALMMHATSEAKKLETAAVSAIQQAARNLLIAFRDGITAELDSVIKAASKTAYTADCLKEILPIAVSNWIKNGNSNDISILLSPDDTNRLQDVLLASLKKEISEGIDIKPSSSISAGFQIGSKDGSFYYDFSSESVAALFSEYLNPRVAEIMKSAAKEL